MYKIPRGTSKNAQHYMRNLQKWQPQYHTNSTLSDSNDILYLGRLLCPEFIPNIEQFLAVAAKIKHCPISSKFDMWVDNDVPN
jgi:hypothetical protein